MKAIEADNEDLKGVLPRTYAVLDNSKLAELLKLMASIPMERLAIPAAPTRSGFSERAVANPFAVHSIAQSPPAWSKAQPQDSTHSTQPPLSPVTLRYPATISFSAFAETC